MSAEVPQRPATLPADVGWALAAGVLTWLVFAPFASFDIDAFHDGVMLKPAMDVAAGQTLFRDTLMWYGPLTTWLQSAQLLLFGRTLLVLRLGTVFVYGLIAIGQVLCWQLVLPRTLVVVTFGVWLLFAPLEFVMEPWSSVYASCFQTASLFALLRAVTTSGGRGWSLVSGILAGMTFLSRHFPVGVFTCLGVLAAYGGLGVVFPSWRRRAIDAVITAGAGMAAVVGAFLLYAWWAGSLEAWWQQAIVWPLGQARTAPTTFPALDFWWKEGLAFCAFTGVLLILVRTGRTAAVLCALAFATIYAVVGSRFDVRTTAWGTPAVALLLAFGGAVWVALHARRAPAAPTVLLLAALVIGLASWPEVSPTGHPAHVFWALSSSFGFVIFAAWCLAGRRTALVATLLVLLWIPFGSYKIASLRGRLTAARVELAAPPVLAGMREVPAIAAEWTALADAMFAYSRTRPRWTMLLEGNNTVALTMAPDLTNGDVRFFKALDVLPYDGLRRAQYVRDRRPLVLRQVEPGEPVQQALEQIGYVPLVKLKLGVLLAPHEVPGKSGSSPSR